jgi:hypothetical protein
LNSNFKRWVGQVRRKISIVGKKRRKGEKKGKCVGERHVSCAAVV